MDRDRALTVAGVLVLLGGAAFFLIQSGLVPLPGGGPHERATVEIVDDGEVVATVDARVADTPYERRQGLSGTDSLANGSGMLFVHDSEGRHTYIMPGMNYGLDIIFVDAEGQITSIQSAPPPGPGEDGSSIQRTGTGKWVLEVPRGYANATGIEVGDTVEIQYRD